MHKKTVTHLMSRSRMLSPTALRNVRVEVLAKREVFRAQRETRSSASVGQVVARNKIQSLRRTTSSRDEVGASLRAVATAALVGVLRQALRSGQGRVGACRRVAGRSIIFRCRTYLRPHTFLERTMIHAHAIPFGSNWADRPTCGCWRLLVETGGIRSGAKSTERPK